MAGPDDPFDRETQNRWNFRLSEKSRSNVVPLETHYVRPTANNLYTGYSGEIQTTLSKDTEYPEVRRMLGKKDLHPSTRRSLKRGDYGSSFFTKKLALTEGPDPVSYGGSFGSRQEWMWGYRWPCSNAYAKSRMNWQSVFNGITTPISELQYWGTEGIARTLPTVPENSLVTTLGELGQHLPKVPGGSRFGLLRKGGGYQAQFDRRKPTLGEASDEFLNYTFGISPTVSDARNIGATVANADEIIARYRQDANRLVRRRVVLHEESDTTTMIHREAEYPFGYRYIDPLANAVGDCKDTVTTTRRVWFSGAYQYDLPPIEPRLEKLREFNRLYGILPTSEDLWNLTAWSWLTDWYANTGTLLSNLSTLSRDGIRIHHAYVMMEVKKEYKYSNFGNSVSFTEVSKNRIRASPFGYARRPGNLSNKERAILTALGISRWS